MSVQCLQRVRSTHKGSERGDKAMIEWQKHNALERVGVFWAATRCRARQFQQRICECSMYFDVAGAVKTIPKSRAHM